jgi:hypothetical protein
LPIGEGEIAYPPSIRREGQQHSTPAADRPESVHSSQTLLQAATLAADLTDPQEKVDAYLALAWAQIKIGARIAARGLLDRASEAAARANPEIRGRARVRIAQACGEVGEVPRGLEILARALEDADSLKDGRNLWLLRDIAVAQAELGDRNGAKATAQSLAHALPGLDRAQRESWSSELSLLVEALLAAGDADEAFRICGTPAKPWGQHYLLGELASAAAGANGEGRYGFDPPRTLTAEMKERRLAIVRRAVSRATPLPDGNQYRPTLVAALSKLGAFNEAVQLARQIDQQAFREQGQVDATWAYWRISLDQSSAGDRDGSRRTLREAERLGPAPGAIPEDWRSRLASGLVRARDFEGALKLAEGLPSEGRAMILSMIARQKRLGGDQAAARSLFARALIEAHRYLDGPPPPERKSAGPVPAVDATGSDVTSPAAAEVRHRARAMSGIAIIHVRAGDWIPAEKAFEAITAGDDTRRHTAFAIASYRAQSGDLLGALSWARSLTSPSLRASAIRGIAVGVFGNGDEFD